MHIGDINLEDSFDSSCARFVTALERLQLHGMEQYVVVRNEELAIRLKPIENVTVGPCVRSAITAHCLIPSVDVVHLHDRRSWHAGLLLVLTRSIPFVLAMDANLDTSNNPVTTAIRRRAAGLIDPEVADIALYLQLYRQAAQHTPDASPVAWL